MSLHDAGIWFLVITAAGLTTDLIGALVRRWLTPKE